MTNIVSVIDLFAGPGGLGEGFSSFTAPDNSYPFKIAISVEKEAHAHQTLQLRAFFRQFSKRVPQEYYDYIKGGITREELFALYPDESAAAISETLLKPRELGKEEDDIAIRARLRKLRKTRGEKVLIGGPPCQAYSLVGRARNKGIEGYTPEDDHRHFLYREYLNVLQMMEPDVFVMENVKGILSSKVNGKRIFPIILQDLRNPGKALGKKGGSSYTIHSLVSGQATLDPEDAGRNFTIRSEDYGVPQSRHRVILLGIKNGSDLNEPDMLKTAGKSKTVEMMLYDFPALRSGLSKGEDSAHAWYQAIEAATKKLKNCCSKELLDSDCLAEILAESHKLKTRGNEFQKRMRKFVGGKELQDWIIDPRLNGFVNHQTRGHMEEDLARYMFCALYAEKNNGASPTADVFPAALTPNHKNWKSGNFVDRFKVQSRNKPSSTITSHISKDGHYFIHPDPAQCRSLTVREAARLQTFPDNYFFEGGRTGQYVQVGNAVPPLLARQIADIVYRVLR